MVVDIDQLNALTGRVIAAAIHVHSTLGPGLLESTTYQACLLYALGKAGLKVEAQVPVTIFYDGRQLLDVGYRMDILGEDALVLKLKSIEAIAPVHRAQLLSYLRHSGK